jgi:hypothetical protein
MNDDRCPVEQHTGHLVRVFSVVIAGEETIKYDSWIWQRRRLDGQRPHATCIVGVGGSQLRNHYIVAVGG